MMMVDEIGIMLRDPADVGSKRSSEITDGQDDEAEGQALT